MVHYARIATRSMDKHNNCSNSVWGTYDLLIVSILAHTTGYLSVLDLCERWYNADAHCLIKVQFAVVELEVRERRR